MSAFGPSDQRYDTPLSSTEADPGAGDRGFRALAELAPVGIFRTDAHGRFSYINARFAAIVGCAQSDCLAGGWIMPVVDIDRERVLAAWARTTETGQPFRGEFRIQRSDGGLAWVICEARRDDAAARGSPCFIGTLTDITDFKQVRNEQERFFELSADLLCVAGMDGFYRQLSPSWTRVLGWSRAELLKRPWLEFVHPDDRADTVRVSAELVANRPVLTFENRYLTRDGAFRWLSWKAMPLPAEGLVFGIARDVTEEKQAQARLLQAAAVFESTLEGVMITDPHGVIRAVNRAFTTITGYPEEVALGCTPRLLRSNRHDASFYDIMWAAIRAEGHWQGEIWNRRKNDEVYPEWLTISAVKDAQENVINYVAVFSDISHLKQSEARLEHLAHYDALTELPNRMLLSARLDHAVERAHRHKHMVAVLFLDLDRFKNVNDSLGHAAGDELLIAVARRLHTRLREEDTLARLGGDEFVLLLEDLEHPDDAARLAREVISVLSAPFQVAGHEVFVGASIGISLLPGDASSSTELVRKADAALYQAKESGRNTFRFYTEALTRSANERLRLDGRLRRALDREELTLHYQPQIDLGSGGMIGCEALLRWNSPDEGAVSPLRFIPIAEETGLIVALGEWALRAACRQGKAWLDAGVSGFTLAVNLSARQFRDADLNATLVRILAETGFPPDRLELEITESAIMDFGADAVARLHGLKDLGISLALDDFGTGYSSLAYLRRFAVDKLKIDRSFILDIPGDRDDGEIAGTIIAMARKLRLRVVAEGVERDEQLEFLRREGCDTYQGFLAARPMVASAFAEFARSRRNTPPGSAGNSTAN